MDSDDDFRTAEAERRYATCDVCGRPVEYTTPEQAATPPHYCSQSCADTGEAPTA